MDLKFKKWKDFNNLSVKVSINKKNYDAILIVDNNRLILKIDMSNNIPEWRKIDGNYDILSGKFLFENYKIFFINCICTGHSSTINCVDENIKVATVDFIVDRLILGKNLLKTSLNKIQRYSASYKNMNLFSIPKSLTSNLKTIDFDSNTHSHKIETPSYSINMMFYCHNEESQRSLSIKRLSAVEFNHSKPVNIKKVIENIYMFRNFLMIILKHPIYVEKQTLYINDNSIELFDCNDNNELSENSNLEEMLSHRGLKIENIDNISDVYNNFINNYKQLCPLLELYYNVTQFNVPNLTRFINSTTMLENYSRNYDFEVSFALTKSKYPNSQDVNYADMIISLITNVNEVFNYTAEEIKTIANNIKSARIYYIHYKTRQKSKPLTYDEQFHYSYFIEDIVLLNIYKLISLDITKNEYISFNQFYYDKYDFI